MSATDVDRLKALYPLAWDAVRQIPGVAGLGIGVVERAEVAASPAVGWRVYVDAPADLPPVPASLAGHPTLVVPQSEAFLCYGNDFQATLKPGIEVASKGNDGGTLGCFARLKSDPSKIVILSNSHVLYGDTDLSASAGNGTAVGQPSVSCCCCCKCRVVAHNRRNAFNSVRVRITHPSFSGTKEDHGSEVDGAIAVLNSARPYTNQGEYGMITGAPASGLGVSGGDRVEMVGSTSGRKSGTIVRFTTNTKYLSGGIGTVSDVLFPFSVGGGEVDDVMAGALRNINQLFIVPDADPADASRKVSFVQGGDSGAVIVNAAKEVVGIVVRAGQSAELMARVNLIASAPLPPHVGNLGIACPIGRVLSLLDIEIVNNMSGTAPASGEELLVPESERVRQLEVAIALENTLRNLDREVRSKALGREVMELIDAHRPEIHALIHRKREVTVAWQRSQGPAYAAHVLNSVKDHRYRIPADVRGVTPAQLVTRMAGVLRKHGSARLRADVERYEPLALEWVVGKTSVWELVEQMRRLESEPAREDVEALTVG